MSVAEPSPSAHGAPIDEVPVRYYRVGEPRPMNWIFWCESSSSFRERHAPHRGMKQRWMRALEELRIAHHRSPNMAPDALHAKAVAIWTRYFPRLQAMPMWLITSEIEAVRYAAAARANGIPDRYRFGDQIAERGENFARMFMYCGDEARVRPSGARPALLRRRPATVRSAPRARARAPRRARRSALRLAAVASAGSGADGPPSADPDASRASRLPAEGRLS